MPYGCLHSDSFTKCWEWIHSPPRCPGSHGARPSLITQVETNLKAIAICHKVFPHGVEQGNCLYHSLHFMKYAFKKLCPKAIHSIVQFNTAISASSVLQHAMACDQLVFWSFISVHVTHSQTWRERMCGQSQNKMNPSNVSALTER